MKVLWSAHPLLRVEPGAEIILPREVTVVEVAWSLAGRLGKPGDQCAWPEATECSSQTVSLNQIVFPSLVAAEKCSRLVFAKGSVVCSCREKMKASLFGSIPIWFRISAFGSARVDGQQVELPKTLPLLLNPAAADPILSKRQSSATNVRSFAV